MGYHRNPSVVSTELDDGAILLDLDTRYYYNLNETGLRIWQLVDRVREETEIAKRLSNEFAVDENAALSSTRRLMKELEENRLIVSEQT